jgi:hypothetical protein
MQVTSQLVHAVPLAPAHALHLLLLPTGQSAMGTVVVDTNNKYTFPVRRLGVHLYHLNIDR